jgi:DNA-binding PadR family transcriptional regulator
LRDGPKHGYEIIKALEERSSGQYVPSPGTVYPTLQYLEDQGFVRANQEADRRIYQLTGAGQTELAAQAEQVAAFWARFANLGVATASQHEVTFLQEELEHLNRIVWGGLRAAIAQGQQEPIRTVRTAIEECQNKIRQIISTEMISGETISKEQTQ